MGSTKQYQDKVSSKSAASDLTVCTLERVRHGDDAVCHVGQVKIISTLLVPPILARHEACDQSQS